jgi:hypothetical protein
VKNTTSFDPTFALIRLGISNYITHRISSQLYSEDRLIRRPAGRTFQARKQIVSVIRVTCEIIKRYDDE